MAFDDRVGSLESGLDSGDADAAPEVGSDGAPEASAEVHSPVPDSAEGLERELEAVVGGEPEPRPGFETEESDPPTDPQPGAEVDIVALTAKADRADEYLGLAQRTKADFDNYRKRAMRDAAAARERGAVKLAMELLPAVDNLERALAHADSSAPREDDAATFVSGIRHVHNDVLDALKRAGIESYSPDGQPFDPTYHEAVAQAPTDGAQPGTVVEVFQRGYRMGENVLRPARVVVAG